jgi:hypothetical protein
MKEHHDSVSGARARVEPYLRAWALHHALTGDLGWFSFDFREALVRDRANPGAPGQTTRQFEPGSSWHQTGTISLRPKKSRPDYPAPPENFLASKEVETLWARYASYVSGGEPLASVANYVRTFLTEGRSKADAARRYALSGKVIDTLGRLTSEGMGGLLARKYSSDMRPYTEAETRWLEAAVRVIIRRVGECAAGKERLPQITLGELPPLE